MNLTYAGTIEKEWGIIYIWRDDKSQNIPIKWNFID